MVLRLVIFDTMVMSDCVHSTCHIIIAAVVLDFRHVNNAKTSEATLVADWELIVVYLAVSTGTFGIYQICIAMIFVVLLNHIDVLLSDETVAKAWWVVSLKQDVLL